MAENLIVYDESAVTATVSNSTTETVAYDVTNHITEGVIGGTIGEDDTLWICSRFKISFNDNSAQLTVRIKFGASAVITLTFRPIDGAPYTDLGLAVEGYISNLANAGVQAIHASGTIELPISDTGGVPNARVGGAEDTNSDQPLQVTMQWNNASSGNSATHDHTFVVVVGPPAEIVLTEPDSPLTQVLSVSLLNNLPVVLYKDVTFYGEFLHHLDFLGIGSATVARASSQNATWRDGGSHSVAANLPRFEYSGETAQGLLINSGVSETLTIDSANALDSSNTLFWKENGVTKNTPTNTNPFNGSGVWTGTNNIHISHVMKFNRVLSATEVSQLTVIYNQYVLL